MFWADYWKQNHIFSQTSCKEVIIHFLGLTFIYCSVFAVDVVHMSWGCAAEPMMKNKKISANY
jgi:hypothetical protein